MAKQSGIIRIEGTIGDITFYKSRDGHLVREKGGINANRIKTDPAFQRTRENGEEFGRAGKAGRVLRHALRPLLLNVKDNRLATRLVAEMMKVVLADRTSERGQRNVIDGETALLEGFDFNSNGKLNNTLFASYTDAINRTTGKLTVTIPAFDPTEAIAAPAGATHFQLVTGGCAVDFAAEGYECNVVQSAVLPLVTDEIAALTL